MNAREIMTAEPDAPALRDDLVQASRPARVGAVSRSSEPRR